MEPSDRPDLLNAFIGSKDANGDPIHPDQLRGEVIGTLAAGSDTTGMTILGCIGHLMQNPTILSKLQEEQIQAVREGKLDNDTPTYTQLASLSYLSAVITETLRLSPAIGAAFYRTIPAGGAKILPDIFLPGGVEVGINNWVMGRNKGLYGPDASIFRPERWLEVEEEKHKFQKFDFSFGYGSRT